MSGGEAKQPTRSDWGALALVFGILLTLMAIATAPVPFYVKSAICAALLLAVAVVILRGSR